jgi:hypothetical protein
MAAVTKPLALGKRKPAEKVDLLVKYFDESQGLEPSLRDILNERIREVETQARTMIF